MLEPELEYEGGRLALAPSRRGLVSGPVRQLRDPAIYREDGRTYLLYSVAGEHGLAIADLLEDSAAGAPGTGIGERPHPDRVDGAWRTGYPCPHGRVRSLHQLVLG